VFSLITAKLASESMLSIDSVHIDTNFEDALEHLTVALGFDENEWSERRKDDGFVLLVAHSLLPRAAQELVSVYQAKDTTEKNSPTNKTGITRGPVLHHTVSMTREHRSIYMRVPVLGRTIGFAG